MTQRASSAAVVRRESREEISRIATAHGAGNVRVFGSAGREEAGAHDLDLLVEMATDRNLFDLSQELEDTLGIAVDVVSEGALPPYLRERILAEAPPL
ncbi:MAG TPA: nucleotidyltransferase domain-containing protein [Solirubrobacterales bacterium]|nr:nucleotidyltransferase domain-containing protein [Solirubrobacterales bacterium]